MNRSRLEKPIFMIGMPRSGTSALGEAISLHKELGWISNYTRRFPGVPYFALVDRAIDNLPLRSYLRGKKKQGAGMALSLRRFLPYSCESYIIWRQCCGEKFSKEYLLGQTATEEEKRSIRKYVATLLRYQGKKRFFTKFTGPPRIHYLRSIFPDACFIHVIRDSRAVTSSLLQVPFWKKGEGLIKPWWQNGMTENDLREWDAAGKSATALAAVQWKRVVELAWEESRALPENAYLEIRYEDFVADPHRSIKRVFLHFGLEDCSDAHRYVSSIGKLRNMNYKYKTNLPPEDIALIEKLTTQTARRAGYHF